MKIIDRIIDTITSKLIAIIPQTMDFAQRVIIAVVMLALGLFIIKFLLNAVDKVTAKFNMDLTIKKFFISVLRVVLYCVLVILVAGKVGIETTAFVTILASAGLALGLALQGSLSNLAGSVIILLTRPFKVGDYIVDNGSGQEGTVNKIDIVYTSLITPDNRMITIPNGALANSAVTNVSAFDTRRISVQANIKYTSDVELAKSVLVKMANADERVLKDKEIFAFVNSLGPSAVLMELRVWVKADDYWAVTFDMNEKVKKLFEENGIEITCGKVVVEMQDAK
ncbi:MAG: mechanosensitive ion channel family protein [Lachnospiraceae bacterium]|nr:mechanosensitive ion channel family protein [Lachnospiraceae bacterium]